MRDRFRDRKELLMPARYMIIYLSVTIALFLFGYMNIELKNEARFLFFLIISNLFAYWGFKFGACRLKLKPNNETQSVDMNRVINILFWIALCIAIPKYMVNTGDYKLNIWSRLTTLLGNTATFRSAYEDKMSLASVTGIWKVINVATIVISPLHWAYMPLSLYYWEELSVFKKIGSAFILFLNSFMYISGGASVGLVHFFIFFIGARIAKSAIESSESREARKRKRKAQRKTKIIIIALAIVAFWGFGFIMSGRSNGYEASFITIGTQVVSVNKESLLWKITPPYLRSTMIHAFAYLLKPYSAVDLALSIHNQVEVPICFGAGGSWFLASNVGNLLGIDIMQRTYNMRLDEIFGYNYYTQWHTVYVWLANDFTFYLVPFALFGLMTIWGAAWRDYLNNKNILALLLMFLFVEFVFFMPMNNQVFQHPDTLFAFWGVFAYWLYSRRKYSFV